MKRIVTIPLCVLSCSAVFSGYPGSALVTDLNDNAYFAYWGGTWKLNSTARAERIHPNDFHSKREIAGGYKDHAERQARSLCIS